MISYTEAQVLAFVPDAGTLQRGQQLARPAQWAGLGRSAAAAWGECAGSGAKPYLTGLDLREPAFKCSCPSRVFPCKHGAALLLLLARQPELFPNGTPPAWLGEWLAKREQAQERKSEKAGAAPVDEPGAAPDAAEAGRAPGEVDPKRLARMSAGAADFSAWLEDLVRAGLAALDQSTSRLWEGQAARLVDQQLPGLAAALRELPSLRAAHADWPGRLLARLGELYLLSQTFQNLPRLSPAARAEVLQLVGVNIKKEDLLGSTAPVADEWQVLGQFRWEEDRLTARRSWLRGRQSGQLALVLEFAFGNQPFATALVPQGRYLGELAYYPGLLPLRAAPVNLKFNGPASGRDVPPGQSISQLLESYADALARQPWLREWPATLSQVLPVRQPDGSWRLHHAREPHTLALRLTAEDAGWQLLAQGGGQPLTLFGEWDGQRFRPLGSWLSPVEEPAVEAGPEARADLLAAEPATEAVAPVPPNGALLLRVALLGTRQSGESLPPFPRPAASSEEQVLLAAGTLALARKAGYQPAPARVAPPAPAPAEVWTPLGPTGADCLRLLLSSPRFTSFKTNYFALLREHHRLVPPALLVDVLSDEEFRLYLPGDNAVVLGERGRWLAAQHPDWQTLVAPVHPNNDLATWETGTFRDRRFFIQLLHKDDPTRARELLAQALPTEPVANQAALLSELEPSLNADDAPLLLPFLGSKSKEVRQTVVPLLVRLPGSGLVERLWQRAAGLLTIETKKNRRQLVVTLPDGWDKSWLADGIEQQDSRFEGGPRAAWLGQLLTLLPPNCWSAQLGLSPEELLPLAEASEWQLLLLRSWARAAFLHQDKAFARPLLLRHLEQPDLLPPQLATHLTQVLDDEKTELLRGLLQAAAPALPHAFPRLLAFLSGPWPADMVAAALRYVAEVLAPTVTHQYGAPYQELSSLLRHLEQYVPDPQLAQCAARLRATAETYPAIAPLVESFEEGSQFLQRLHASLTEREQ